MRVVLLSVYLFLLSSCSGVSQGTFEKSGTILGTVGGVGGGHYMCSSYGFDPKFTIGCSVIGGLMGGVMGGLMGETFDNKEIYDTVRNNITGHEPNVYSRSDGSVMKVQVVDDYVEDQGWSFVGDKTNTWCKDFEFEVQKNGVFERGRGKSCRDEFGKWETMGMDLIK